MNLSELNIVDNKGTIHLWIFDSNLYDLSCPQLFPIFQKFSQCTDHTYINPQDQDHFIFRSTILKNILSRYTGISISDLDIMKNPQGKPYLPQSPYTFNLTHCDAKLAIAISKGIEIGIDLEKITNLVDLDESFNFILSQSEKVFLTSSDHTNRSDLFFHIWTQKEAFLKAIGRGFSISPRALSVSMTLSESKIYSCESIDDPAFWQIFTFSPFIGYKLAVCAGNDKDVKLIFHEIQSTDQLVDLLD
jgi:phosphopantetheine--protein transferase-like protein